MFETLAVGEKKGRGLKKGGAMILAQIVRKKAPIHKKFHLHMVYFLIKE